MPAGKAIASVAMPTAVIMGMGFTSTLAIADSTGTSPASNSQKAADYKDCVSALDGSGDASPSASASATPSATATPSAADSSKDSPNSSDSSGTSGSDGSSGSKGSESKGSSDPQGGADKASSPDSGSDGKAAALPSAPKGDAQSSPAAETPATTPAPSKSADGGLLGSLGNAIGDVLTGGKQAVGATTPAPAASSTAPAPAPSATSGTDKADADKSGTDKAGSDRSDADKAGTSGGAATTKKAPRAVQGTPEKDAATTPSATRSPSADPSTSASPDPSASDSAAPEDCLKATDDKGGVDNKLEVANDPWYLNASSLLLKGADYKGVVEVRTADGTTKKVLKYVISGGTDIGDLHQTVKDEQAGKTYHVQAAKGSMSTITGGDTVMYTESISGNLFGLIPVTFSPDSPPPLNIPLIYFTDAKVTQAGQFGGNLHIPGMQVYTTD
ncbi:hypothetical protein [Streptomyces sp. NPDC048242]|uniref:hypothetical protein n=1 Tax=Streptomyces sp. NPDC048242 TaxID=3155026 RepID=UPI0033CE765F